MVVETSLIMGGSVGLLLVVVRMRTSGKNVVRGEMERERAHTHTHISASAHTAMPLLTLSLTLRVCCCCNCWQI